MTRGGLLFRSNPGRHRAEHTHCSEFLFAGVRLYSGSQSCSVHVVQVGPANRAEYQQRIRIGGKAVREALARFASLASERGPP
jgi:hypothetical protein